MHLPQTWVSTSITLPSNSIARLRVVPSSTIHRSRRISATINSADLLGWKDQIGSIKVGKYADIVAVTENPLDQISVLENVQFVMKGGVVYKNLMVK